LLTDLEIARGTELRRIADVAADCGILREELELYGDYKAKVRLEALERLADRPNGRYIDVTAITPTPLGEGKTVTTIGATQALCRIGRRAAVCVRQPSLGPVFGVKGGAAGGGHSQIIPMEDVNLHLTGDIHAVSIAHNLAAAFLDNSLKRGNPLKIDPSTINWSRVLDLSDRWGLGEVITGLSDGFVRKSGFEISAASELMAVLGLAVSLQDLRRRVGRCVIGQTYKGESVTCDDLKCAGAMTVLLRDALKPNLMQTLEGGPAFVHTGPFANIAHGNSSILADMLALKTADYVLTESGFGADIGMEKFMDIKCRISGLVPNAVLVVATIRALKMHGNPDVRVVPGRPLPKAIEQEDPEAVVAGCANLAKHLENVRLFGVHSVVCINRFDTDRDSEIEAVREQALAAGAERFVISEVWQKGGAGGEELAEALVEACEKPSHFRLLYPDDAPIKEKIETIAKRVYGAKSVNYAPLAERQIEHYGELGYAGLPVCMAKTHFSLSHDPNKKGRPTGFRLPVREVHVSRGAGFLYPLCGDIRTMPGLPTTPAGERVDIDEDGNVVGLF
jgi:formyltetrahydrofolate synthetase